MPRELCPNDGTELWYATDAIGRLTGRCDTCSGRFAHSTVQVNEVPERRVVLTAHLEKLEGLILSAVRANPGISRGELGTIRGIGRRPAVRDTIERLVATGRVREFRVRSETEHSKMRRVLFLSSHRGEMPTHNPDTPTRVLGVILSADRPMLLDEISAAVGVTMHHAAVSCRRLAKRGKLRATTVLGNPRGQKRVVKLLAYVKP